MKKPLYLATITTMILALLVASVPADAVKPQRQVGEEMVYVGNGYPSGFHYNLHFLAKRLETFTCPDEAEYAFETPDKNVIYVPRVQDADIGVLVESGKKGPKSSDDPTVFEVTDWCSKDFLDAGEASGDDATLRIPPDAIGYLVYARITGKPFFGKVKDETTEVYYANLGGCLNYAEDETLADNNLILLGLVTSTGVYVPTCDQDNPHGEQILLQRTGSNGNGVKKAVPITPIFEWSGTICNIDPLGTDVFCCVDVPTADGIYEHCDSLADLQQADPLLTECPDTVDISDPDYGGLLYSTVYASCATYTDKWVFNIADFVGYLWSVDSNGAYNINVRFYPCSEQPPGTCGE